MSNEVEYFYRLMSERPNGERGTMHYFKGLDHARVKAEANRACVGWQTHSLSGQSPFTNWKFWVEKIDHIPRPKH